MKFRAFVTVTNKRTGWVFWNRTIRSLDGDKSDLKNLIHQLELTKQDVNQFVANKENIPLRELNIKIEFN